MGGEGDMGGFRRARTVLAGLLVALVATSLAGCGLGPFAGGSGAGAPTAAASPGPEVPSPAKSSPTPSPMSDEPNAHSTVGALAKGFPSDLLPVPHGAEVLVSSVEQVAGSDAYQVSLNLRTSLSTDEIVAVYRKSLTGAGFVEAEQTTPDEALAAQSTFTRSAGDELLVIGVLDANGIRTVTIGGRLRGQ